MIKAIFAVDYWGGMGYNGTLPWPHNSADLKNFKSLTMGHVVVMGGKTYDDTSMPKPLNGRIAYVATKRNFVPYASVIQGDLREEVLNLEKKHPDKIIWVIGGAQVLEQCGDILDRIHLTHYKKSYRIDTKINLKTFLSGWIPVRATVDPKDNFTVVIYENLFKRRQ